MSVHYTEKDLAELLARAKDLGVNIAVNRDIIEEQRKQMEKASSESAKGICWGKIEEQAKEIQSLVGTAELNNAEELDE